MAISVRMAKLTDAPAIATVNLASWDAAYRGIVADTVLDSRTIESRIASWTQLLSDAGTVLVAEADADSGADADRGAGGILIGYCALSLPARDGDCGPEVAEIAALYVSPAVFRGGVGSALMTHALELIISGGYREVILWVLTQNASARAFYARHGFGADGSAQWIEGLQAEEIRLRRQL